MSGKRQWQTGDMEADALSAVGKRSSKGSLMQHRTILSLSGNGIMKKMNFSRNRSRFPARRKSGGNAAKAIHGRQSFLPGATEADARTAGTAGWHREKTILHPGSRSSSKNGIMKKTGGSCRKTLHINPVRRSGGSVRKDIPGKLKSITGQRERGVRSAPNWRTIILSRPGKPTWQRSAPDSRLNGITDGTGDCLPNRSGRFQQEKCGGSAAVDIIGSVRFRSGSAGQDARSAMEGSTDSQG